MAIRQISQTPIGTTDFTDLKEEVTRNARGLNTISLSNYALDTAPVVKVGSVFENNNVTFLVETGDETPTGYAGITVSTTFYLYYDETGGVFIYSNTVPTWSDALQGYYNGNDRAFYSMFKDSGGTLYDNKFLLFHQNNIKYSGMQVWKNYYKSTNSPTEQTVFNALTSWIPNVGDRIACHGQAKGGSIATTVGCIDYIFKLDATTINMNYADSTGQAILTINSTDNVTVVATNIEMMSNFDTL